MSQDTHEKSVNKTPLLIGAAAGLATYALARRPKITNYLQEVANRDGITIGSDWGAKKIRHTLGKLLYSHDLKFTNINKEGPQRYKGVLYSKNIIPNNQAVGKVTVNSPEVVDKLLSIGSSKEDFASLPGIGHYFPKSRTLHEALSSVNVHPDKFKTMSDDEVGQVFNKINEKHGPQFIKPSAGEAMGKGTSGVYGDITKAHKYRKVKPGPIEKFFKYHKYEVNPEGSKHIRENSNLYMLQDYAGEGSEHRIHILNDKVVDEVHRFGGFEGAQTGAKLLKPHERDELAVNLRSMYKAKGIDLAHNHVAFALDATRDQSGKVKFFEMNPNSGFLFNLGDLTHGKYVAKPWEYWSTHRMYKNLTGKDTSAVAGIKALAIGGAATYGATKLEKKGEDKDYTKPLLAGAVVTAGTLAALRFRKNPSKFYHVVSEDSKPYAQQHSKSLFDKARHWTQWGDIKHVSMGDIRGKSFPKDTVYYDVHSGFLEGETPVHAKKIINADLGVIRASEDKAAIGKIPSKHILPTHELPSHVTEDTLHAEASKLVGKDFIIKPRFGSRGEGVFIRSDEFDSGARRIDLSQEMIDILRKKSPAPHRSPNLRMHMISKNPSDYVVQPLIADTREYRVIAHNDKTMSVFPRHGIERPLSDTEAEAMRKMVSETHTDITKAHKPTGDLYLGHDVKFDKGIPKIIEVNTQEGYFWKHPNKLQKSVTGRNLPQVALAKSLVPGVGAAAIVNKMDRKES